MNNRVHAVATGLAHYPDRIPQDAFASAVHAQIDGFWVRDADQLEDPHRDLYQYWVDARTAGDLPTIKAIVPERFARHLSFILLLDAVDGGLDARYRVYSSGVSGPAGRDWTGFTISEMTAITQTGEEVYYRSVYYAVALRRAAMMVSHHSTLPLAHREWRRVILPFADEAGAVSRFLVLNKPHQRHYQTPEDLEEVRKAVGKG